MNWAYGIEPKANAEMTTFAFLLTSFVSITMLKDMECYKALGATLGIRR